MTRNSAVAIENNFSKGLVTEATGLNFPENSCIETWDCVFDIFGRVTRREGMDIEFNATTKTIDKTGAAINTYLWKNATGDGLTSFIVVQVGDHLYFYDASNVTSLSAGAKVSNINLATYKASGAPDITPYDCQFADGLAKLFVVSPYLENIYITYNSGTGNFSATQYTLYQRDTEGVDDGLAVDGRPTATLAGLSATHKYNLYNQGWNTTNLTSWDTAFTTMPSNADVMWAFKNSSDAFDTATVPNVVNGNTAAPKGHFILNVYNQDRDTAAGTSGATATTSGTARTSTVAFFAGRVFYSGVNAAKYNGKIYFTQIIERDAQFGFCYQSADPTAEDVFDLQPTDGGVISIPEAGTIYKLFVWGGSLLVFAYRGVWLISGSTGLGFTATDYTVSRIATVKTTSASSFVDVNGTPMWWNTDGIFTIGGNGQAPEVISLSIDTIQTFYNNIPNASKVSAKGIYNQLDQTVQWLFSTTAQSTTEDQNTFNAVLNYNVATKAFYPWTISYSNGTYPTVHGMVVVDATGGVTNVSNVIDAAANNVVDASGNQVVSYSLSNTTTAPVTKFLTSYITGGNDVFTWSETSDVDYVDWAKEGYSVDYQSYFVTGYKVHGDAQRKFQSNYVTFYNEGLGSFYVRGVWDYSEASSTGRWSTEQPCVFDTDDYGVLSTRKKIRGHGKSLQYKVRSSSGEPFSCIGWSTWETGNAAP